MKKIFIVIVVLFLIILFAAVSCSAFMQNGMEEAKKELMSINDPDLSKVKDGVCKGNKETVLVKADVEVSVFNNKITSINKIRHENGKGKPAEVIIDNMVKENTTNVELVSGATMSSLVIRAAVIDALNKGL